MVAKTVAMIKFSKLVDAFGIAHDPTIPVPHPGVFWSYIFLEVKDWTVY